MDWPGLTTQIKTWAVEAGFGDCRIAEADVAEAAPRLHAWLAEGRHGDMDYMERHAALRTNPQALLPEALRAICVRMDYLPRDADGDWRAVRWTSTHAPKQATLSLYAQGRDYHKVLRTRLQRLADKISAATEGDAHRYRVFTDSAPVMEVALATQAGLGWRGKHTLLLNRDAGSMFFLGGLYTNLPLAIDPPQSAHCGTCSACIDVCPTQAITAPYALDARRCIAYLTIEHHGVIPEPFRALIGNRVYGCDDCQLACPWNRYAQRATTPDFDTRHGLDQASLLQLWTWDQATFLSRTEGSAIRRIGYERWRRNLAVGLGNALRACRQATDAESARQIETALRAGLQTESALVVEHLRWALTPA